MRGREGEIDGHPVGFATLHAASISLALRYAKSTGDRRPPAPAEVRVYSYPDERFPAPSFAGLSYNWATVEEPLPPGAVVLSGPPIEPGEADVAARLWVGEDGDERLVVDRPDRPVRFVFGRRATEYLDATIHHDKATGRLYLAVLGGTARGITVTPGGGTNHIEVEIKGVHG